MAIRKTTKGPGANYRPTKSGAGMTAKGVKAYRAANPGSKLKTAVTGKVKKGSAAAKRRKSYCARSLGQLKRSSAKTRNDPNSRIRQARRRWKCQTNLYISFVAVLTLSLIILYLVLMRDSKKLESFLQEKEKENKQQNLFKNLRKEVETGANGTQKYVIKKGENKGKIADVK